VITSGTIDLNRIPRIPMSKIDISITGTNIATGAVSSDKVVDAAVTTPKITDSAVTTAKINDAAVTTAKINDAAVTTTKINDAAVTTAKINDGAVTIAKLDRFTGNCQGSANEVMYIDTTTKQLKCISCAADSEQVVRWVAGVPTCARPTAFYQ